MTHTHPQPPIPPAAGDGNPAPTTGREPGGQPVTGSSVGGRVPGRVWRRRVAGWRLPPNTVVVERSSRWGNPFRVAEYGRAQAIERYREWILTRPELLARLPELAGRDLACTCPPELPCHAEVLLHLANPPQQPGRAHPPTGPTAPDGGADGRQDGAAPTAHTREGSGCGDGCGGSGSDAPGGLTRGRTRRNGGVSGRG